MPGKLGLEDLPADGCAEGFGGGLAAEETVLDVGVGPEEGSSFAHAGASKSTK
ncbi:MAG TPA: hypothetical protein PK156_09435 [Polyangium sp.]|nr:hypothetical protein [Polyangium sp.]